MTNRSFSGDLAKSIRNRTEIKFGVYHSLFEWFNPLFLADKESNFTQKVFPGAKTIPELYELVIINTGDEWRQSRYDNHHIKRCGNVSHSH